MRTAIALSTFLAMTVLMTGAGASAPAVYVSHDKVAQAFGKRGAGNSGQIANQPIRVVGNQRNEPGEAEIHEKEIDVFYVIDGGSTMVTGGKLMGAKTRAPGQVVGTGVEGGKTYHVTKGDVMVIPAGTPHWHKEVKGITYYTVKVPAMSTAADAVYVSHDKVAHAFMKRGPGNDGQIANAPVRVSGNVRTVRGEAEIHENVADVLMVMEGGSTMVTGGTVIGGKTTGPGEIKGSGIQGGTTQQLSKGDVMVIPAGTPHWHKDVQSITYYTVKVPK
jgi:mannose-6-phosphate isomerase-like protein (cupin superfamily)